VSIGAGDGTRIPYRRGDAGLFADPVAILLVLRVVRTKFFEREGTISIASFPFPSSGGIGAEIQLTTLDGDAKIRIPEERRAGRSSRSWQVSPSERYGRGDLIAQIIVRTPGS